MTTINTNTNTDTDTDPNTASAESAGKLKLRIQDNDPNAALKRELARRLALQHKLDAEQLSANFQKPCSLSTFVHEAWPILEQEVPLAWGWYLDAICEHLEAVIDGGIRDMIINIPPRFSKSTIVAIMWPCWAWTFKPHLKFLFASYGQDLSERDSLKCRRLIHSAWYQSHYGARFRLASAQDVSTRDIKDTTVKFENTRGGYRMATSVGGRLTGEGGDILVIDDPLKADDGFSASKRGIVNEWWDTAAVSRLNNPKTGSRVLVMQRLNEDDLTGHWLASGAAIEHLCLPMEYETHDGNGTETPRRSTCLGEYDPRTQEGELLCLERMDHTGLARIKGQMPEYIYAGQYQQRPSPRGGGMFRIDKVEIVDRLPNTAKLLRCRGWDRASTEGGGAYTAGVKMALDTTSNIVYIEDVVRDQWATDQREAVTLATAQGDGRNCYVLLEQEPGSSGVDSVKATGRLLQGFAVKVQRATGKKELRAEPVAAQMSLGNIKLIKGDWNLAYLKELELFPAGKYKDQVDATSLAYNFLTSHTAQMRYPVAAPSPARFVPQ